MTTHSIDPIQFEVIRNALLAATDEMSVALRRSAYSTNIKTRTDYSCALFDRELRTVAQAFNQPVHLGSLAHLTPRAVRDYGPANIEPGDAILANDPYLGGVHLNDITLVSPVYYGDEIFGYVANLAHHVDVGGGSAGSIGAFREVYQEGIIIPPVKLVSRGEIVEDVFRLVMGQIRSKRETAGDFRAQIAANVTGARRLTALLDRLGADVVAGYIDHLLRYTRQRAGVELSRLPRGVFSAEGVVDTDGFTDRPVRLTARIIIDEDGIEFDLSGCDPQRRAPVNSTYAQTFAACAYVLKCLIDPDVPVNDGFYELVRLNAPAGTVVNCTHPAPVVGGWETQTRLTDVLFKALSAALGERMPAPGKGMMAQVGFGGVDPLDGEMYAFYEAIAGGYGGRATRDGPDAVQAHGQNTENAPIEEVELHYPVRIPRYELVDDSEGPGRQRGGLGLRRDYQFIGHQASFTILSDRDRWGPEGLFGGEPAPPARYVLNPDGEEPTDLSAKVTVQLAPDETISFRTCGGGGYGPPAERDPLAVLRDVRDGKISRERAVAIYRIAIDTSSWTVDDAETARLRGRPTAKDSSGE